MTQTTTGSNKPSGSKPSAETPRTDLKERGVPEPNLGPGGVDLNDEEAQMKARVKQSA